MRDNAYAAEASQYRSLPIVQHPLGDKQEAELNLLPMPVPVVCSKDGDSAGLTPAPKRDRLDCLVDWLCDPVKIARAEAVLMVVLAGVGTVMLVNILKGVMM